MAGQDARELHQDRDAAAAVVGAEDRLVAARGVGVLVGHGPRVPVGDEQHAVALLRAKAREHVGHRDRVAGGRAVGEALHVDGVRVAAQRLHHPGELRGVSLGAGRAGPEGDLVLDERVGRVGVEVDRDPCGRARCGILARRRVAARAQEREHHCGDPAGTRARRAPPHRRPPTGPGSCPNWKSNCPNSVSRIWRLPSRMPVELCRSV